MSERLDTANPYFIGGVTLCGKSKVGKAFLDETAPHTDKVLHYTGTDAIRSQGWNNLSDTEEPALFKMHGDRAILTEEEWIKLAIESPDYFVDRQHAEAEVIHRRGILSLLRTNFGRGLFTVIEGVHVLPQHLATLGQPHRAVFVGNNAPPTERHLQNVLNTAQSLPDHWMRKWSKNKIITYVTHLVPAYSGRLRTLASEFDYPYYDLSQGEPTEIWREAARRLIGMNAIKNANEHEDPSSNR